MLVIRTVLYSSTDIWLTHSKTRCKVVPELEQFQRRCLPPDTPPLELPIPRCFHARYTPGRNSPNSSPTPSESVLVLENLKSRGFQGADFSRGLTLRQAESALEAVARLHALSLALKVHINCLTPDSSIPLYDFISNTFADFEVTVVLHLVLSRWISNSLLTYMM